MQSRLQMPDYRKYSLLCYKPLFLAIVLGTVSTMMHFSLFMCIPYNRKCFSLKQWLKSTMFQNLNCYHLSWTWLAFEILSESLRHVNYSCKSSLSVRCPTTDNLVGGDESISLNSKILLLIGFHSNCYSIITN